MKGRIINWNKVVYTPDGDLTMKSAEMIAGALTHFMRKPESEPVIADPKVRAALQHFGVAGDFPSSVLEILEKYNVTEDSDRAYEDCFDIVDFTTSNRNGFKILDVEDGLTFTEVPTGEKVKVFKMGGSEVSVTFTRYGGGLHWDRTLIDDREYWTLEDNAIAFRNRYLYDKANVFYALIDALSATYNVTWQAVTPANVANTNENYNAIRDVNTINAAAQAIVLACESKGMGINSNTNFILLAPLQLKARILRALGVLNAGISGDFKGLVYNVSPRFTTMLSSSSVYYVIAPKRKLKGGIRQNLTVFNQFDPLSYSDIAVGWTRFGGAIGDSNQLRRCATS